MISSPISTQVPLNLKNNSGRTGILTILSFQSLTMVYYSTYYVFMYSLLCSWNSATFILFSVQTLLMSFTYFTFLYRCKWDCIWFHFQIVHLYIEMELLYIDRVSCNLAKYPIKVLVAYWYIWTFKEKICGHWQDCFPDPKSNI